jgi:hypothetical protein
MDSQAIAGHRQKNYEVWRFESPLLPRMRSRQAGFVEPTALVD